MGRQRTHPPPFARRKKSRYPTRMRVTSIRCLEDNYAYLISEGSEAIVVDPSEAPPITEALAREGLALRAILLTHHHHDHVGGVLPLLEASPGLPVFSSSRDLPRISGANRAVSDGDAFQCGPVSARAYSVPGHTLGAIAYLIGDALFTGDTLFIGGCGRLFEGTPEIMHRSLQVLAGLGDAIKVYPGHEYAAQNARFAIAMEPDNRAAHALLLRAEERRALGVPTGPTTLLEEKAHNPFLRVDGNDALSLRHGGLSGGALLGAIRAAKDQFRG